MPSNSIKAAPPHFFSRPMAHTKNVTEKSHLLHSMTVFFFCFFFGLCWSAACAATSKTPNGLFTKTMTDTKPLVSFFVTSVPMWWLKNKKQKQKEYTFFPSFRNDENFCYSQSFKFIEKHRKINKNGLMCMHFRVCKVKMDSWSEVYQLKAWAKLVLSFSSWAEWLDDDRHVTKIHRGLIKGILEKVMWALFSISVPPFRNKSVKCPIITQTGSLSTAQHRNHGSESPSAGWGTWITQLSCQSNVQQE